MGLVMFARYGEDSPLDKGYVQTNDQVRHHAWERSDAAFASPTSAVSADGALLCDGRVQGPAGTSGPLRGLSVLRSAQVGPDKLTCLLVFGCEEAPVLSHGCLQGCQLAGGCLNNETSLSSVFLQHHLISL